MSPGYGLCLDQSEDNLSQFRNLLEQVLRGGVQSEKPQIVRCDTSYSSSSLRPESGRQLCEMRLLRRNLTGRAFAGPPPRLGSLSFGYDQTTFAQAMPETLGKAPSRPGP